MSNPFASQAPTPAATPAASQLATPSGAPAAPGPNLSEMFATGSKAGDGAKIKADMGQAVLIRPTEYVESMTTAHGTTDAVRADWVVLTGPDAGQVREDSLIFQKVLVSTLKGLAGSATPFCIGIVAEGEAKAGKSAPIILAVPEPEHLEYAQRAVIAQGWV